MTKGLYRQQWRMSNFLLVHLLIATFAPSFFTLYDGAWDHLLTFVVATLPLTLLDRRYAFYLFWSLRFLLYLVKEIVVSNLVMAWLIIQPKPKLDPGIIAVPLTVTTGLEITVLSLAIAATPGTLIVELGREASGRVLYVHTLNVGDPDNFRATIKGGFERMILAISRGATA
jgi:multicomponent Na+:H+ antiporter subunit E